MESTQITYNLPYVASINGWEHFNTGGNCVQYARFLDDGGYYLMTDMEGELVEDLDTFVIVGRYDNEGLPCMSESGEEVFVEGLRAEDAMFFFGK